MTLQKGLIMDANILVRAVLGQRVRQLLETYEDTANFYSPDDCFDDARTYLPELLKKNGRDPQAGLTVLEQIARIVQSVDRNFYADYEQMARDRVEIRDADDWPVVATALLLDLPVWTEDPDFSVAESPSGQRIELNFI